MFTAEFFFGKTNAVGETLSVLIGDSYPDFVVSGIVQDIPGNSSLRFDGLLPYSHVFDAYQIDKNSSVLIVSFFTGLIPALSLSRCQAADIFRGRIFSGKKSRIVLWSTCFALIIAGMGLFGMTAVTIVRRTKETGIRKVLRAHVSDILLLFMKDVLRWVIWANLLVWPIAFFVASKWLEGFAYRIDIEVWMFATAAFLSLLIAVLTVGWHVLRTDLSDPVHSLRYE